MIVFDFAAFPPFQRGINTGGNIRTLFINGDGYAAGVSIKADLRGVVTDPGHNSADNMSDIRVGIRGHFTGHVHQPGRHHRFHGNARILIRREQSVKNGVGNKVTHLVGVSFRDRFGRERLPVMHRIPSLN